METKLLKKNLPSTNGTAHLQIINNHYNRPAQPFMWCRQLWQKFSLHTGNMNFNTQNAGWISPCTVLRAYVLIHHM